VSDSELERRINRLIDTRFLSSQQPVLLGKFRLEEILGSGGSGKVYRAKDTKLNRTVALKLLTDTDVRRFAREAQIAAKLDHPSIVRVYEGGEIDGQPYISMQYVEGTALGYEVLDVGRAVEIIQTVAAALDYAHAQGVLHRDVKPTNVLMDIKGKVYLSDFGLGKDTAEDSRLSSSGTVLGTPAFMSPEQATGEKTLDNRTDVYGLGATLYTLLTGKLAHSGDTVMQILDHIRLQDPVPPRTLNPRIPRGVEAVIMKALARDKEQRYKSAGEFATDLSEGGVRAASYYGPIPRFRRYARKKWRWFAGASAVLLVLVLLGGLQAAWRASMAKIQEAGRKIDSYEKLLYGEPADLTKHHVLLDEAIALCKQARAAKEFADFEHGRALAHKREFLRAIERYSAAIDRAPQPRFYYERGMTRLRYLYDRAIRTLDPLQAEMMIYTHAEEVSSAASDLEKATSDLKSWEIKLARAQYHLCRKSWNDAVKLLDEVIQEGDPQALADALKLKADLVNFRLYKPKEAIPLYVRAINIRRCFLDAYLALALAEWEGGHAETGLKISPRDQTLLVGQALIESQKGPSSLAAMDGYLKQAEKIDSNYAPLWTARTLWYGMRTSEDIEAKRSPDENADKALECILRAVKLSPDNSAAMTLLMATYWALHQHYKKESYLKSLKEAAGTSLATANKILKLSPDLFRARLVRADAFFYLEHYAEAMADYDWVLERYPEEASATFGKIRVHWQQKEFVKALQLLAKARQQGLFEKRRFGKLPAEK
jgi:tetratricopeptide (TPR) repeat protein/tRNA A-37 threonylcarbamoyl transferase component Bud32